MEKISWDDFERIEMRVGTIIEVEDFPEARKPAYKLKIDLGDFGIKNSSAQITNLFEKEDFIGKQVICVTNFEPKKIANFLSEVLVLGPVENDLCVSLLKPDRKVKNGLKIA